MDDDVWDCNVCNDGVGRTPNQIIRHFDECHPEIARTARAYEAMSEMPHNAAWN